MRIVSRLADGENMWVGGNVEELATRGSSGVGIASGASGILQRPLNRCSGAGETERSWVVGRVASRACRVPGRGAGRGQCAV